MGTFDTITYKVEGLVARVTFNRPEVHNAFNEVMIKELTQVFKDIKTRNDVRVAVLTGEGKSFCAGADLNWMRRVKDYSFDENLNEALELAELFYLIYSLPKPVIARVNGAAIGGGTGFVAVCDIAIASSDAKFSFSEVKLGLIPACISPYVIRKCGEGRTREFFLTGERLTADRTLEAGLVNQVVSLEGLDKAVDDLVSQLLSSGPNAIAVCKELLGNVPGMSFDEVKKYTAKVIASLRVSEEGQEGMAAFLEKRKPKWSK
ncbi:MAG: enoyl-CoA hydratase/isomerase family protein [bacterium]|nr:enoyl-CoA hydratase/isomerase family protein [bacterium]